MKLLLTSCGLINASIEKALKELVWNKEIKTGFIPTAANVEEGDKAWLINNFVEFQRLWDVDIIDIASLPKEVWLKRLQEVNVIVVWGWDTSYLMEQIKRSWFDKELPKFLEDKVYVGISAGSIATNPTIWLSSEFLFGDEIGEPLDWLNLVNFNIRPHFNSTYFPKVVDENISEIAQNHPNKKIYALDDDSAIRVVWDNIEIVSEWERKEYN